jgi:hypothetical protein
MQINLHTWFQNRELEHCPIHFVQAQTPITSESKIWVLERLKGRFYIEPSLSFADRLPVPYFEDPEEATLYELTWS